MRSELVWSRMVGFPAPDQIIAVIGPVPPVLNPRPAIPRSNPFGFYVSGDYQLGRRWFLGGRFDRSERGNCLPTNPPTTTSCELNAAPGALVRDTGGSLL